MLPILLNCGRQNGILATGSLPATLQAAQRLFASAGAHGGSHSPVKGADAAADDKDDLPKPTYTYQSPGSSLREPGYGVGHSMGSPSYFEYDPKPRFSLNDPNPFASQVPSGKKKQAKSSSKAEEGAKRAAPSQQQPAQQQQQQEEEPQPTYYYASPGSSMREPGYGFSVKDPVYEVDPVPEKPSPLSTPPPGAAAANSSSSSSAKPAEQRHRMGLKDDYAQVGAKCRGWGCARDSSARRVNEVPYVISPRGSMREPHYVSISDPQDREEQKRCVSMCCVSVLCVQCTCAKCGRAEDEFNEFSLSFVGWKCDM